MNLPMNQRFLRNIDLIPQGKLDSALVVGLGGIGSGLVQTLSLMGVRRIVGYDFDMLEEHNLSSTVYPIYSVGMSKAECATNSCVQYGCPNPEMHNARFEDDTEALPITFACTDSMDSRLTVFESWKRLENRELFVDIRMGALSIVIITITKERTENYYKHWFPDNKGSDDPCTAKYTIFTSCLSSSLAVNQFFCYISGLPLYEKLFKGLIPVTEKKESLFIP